VGYTERMNSMARLRAALVTAVFAAAWGCGSVSPVAPDQTSVEYQQTDLVVGTGTEATAGRTATVQYTGWLYNQSAVDNKGSQFDTGAFNFVLGASQVISGFDTAVTGMKVGGTRRAVVPPALAYGAEGNGGEIPPNAALVFDIVLLGIQ
jgi:FKBP-type peptidyl-prolyl cis-trans isomerase FkpA